MKLGKLKFENVKINKALLSRPDRNAVEKLGLDDVLVTEIDPNLSDTTEFCAKYQIAPEVCANCVIVKGSRGEQITYAAVMIDGNSRADINGMVRKNLNVKRISFAPMAETVQLTGMEFGAINPIGLPDDWRILVDTNIAESAHVIIGSGIRKSKLLVRGKLLSELPNATTLDLKKDYPSE
jgi:prolyl-tRNA editing enzyme YbaK/EbsC (Cys-tRNA(Pro) deacylase)